jgi:hypothetical protein
VLCVVDDAQWLDRMSARILAFVARRLEAESVVMVFAVRDGEDHELDGLAELEIRGLDDADARALLDSVLPGRSTRASATGSWPRRAATRWRSLELPQAWTAAELADGLSAGR